MVGLRDPPPVTNTSLGALAARRCTNRRCGGVARRAVKDQEEILQQARDLAKAEPGSQFVVEGFEAEVLVLRHYEEMNFEAMARLLGTPASTLKSRFAVALRHLRVRLQQLGWSHEETR